MYALGRYISELQHYLFVHQLFARIGASVGQWTFKKPIFDWTLESSNGDISGIVSAHPKHPTTHGTDAFLASAVEVAVACLTLLLGMNPATVTTGPRPQTQANLLATGSNFSEVGYSEMCTTVVTMINAHPAVGVALAELFGAGYTSASESDEAEMEANTGLESAPSFRDYFLAAMLSSRKPKVCEGLTGIYRAMLDACRQLQGSSAHDLAHQFLKTGKPAVMIDYSKVLSLLESATKHVAEDPETVGTDNGSGTATGTELEGAMSRRVTLPMCVETTLAPEVWIVTNNCCM